MHAQGLRIKLSRLHHIKVSEHYAHFPFVFQNAPLDEFTREYGYEHTKFKTIKKGEFSRRAGRNLRSVNFNTLFVMIPYPWVTAREQPYDYERATSQLVQVCERGIPFRLLATLHGLRKPVFSLPHGAVIDTLRVSDRQGETDARYFDIGVSEWRDPVAKRRRHRPSEWPKWVHLHADGHYTWNINKRYPPKRWWPPNAQRMQGSSDPLGEQGLPPGGGAQGAAADASMQAAVFERPPLTWAMIARYAYGAPSLWRQVAEANGIDWGANWSGHESLIRHKKYRHSGGKIKVPAPIRPPKNVHHTRSTTSATGIEDEEEEEETRTEPED